ncbi:MAG: TIGR01620 family protein [Pseudomonadota bacterium]
MTGPTTQPKTSASRAPQVIDLSKAEVEATVATFEEEPASGPAEPARRPYRWLAMFASGLLGLIVIGVTLWAENLVRALIAEQPVLGYVALAFAILALMGAVGFVVREVRAVMRLSTLDALRAKAQEAFDEQNLKAARETVDSLLSVYASKPSTAQSRARFVEQRQGVLDARDLLIIGEDTLLGSLDERAVASVSSAARRVSLVTALSPRALIDIAMVAFQCVAITRQIAELYGARPGLLGGLRLFRHMMGHLALTGGMAATEGLVSQVLGHSLAARLSARLGEGVINGLLTARVGIAAIAVMRPLPYFSGNEPTLSQVTRGMASLNKADEDEANETDQ